MDNFIHSINKSGFLSTYIYENKLYQPLTYYKNFSTLKIKGSSLPPFNIISDIKSQKCAIMIFINVGYFQELQNREYKDYIKLLLYIIFEKENAFNKLFSIYNLKYKTIIDIEKTIIYFDFNSLGFEKIFKSFIEILSDIQNILVKINTNDLLDKISMADTLDTDYIAYNKIINNSLTDIKSYREYQNIYNFFENYILKNNNIQFTFLLHYSLDKSIKIVEKKARQLIDKIRKNTSTKYKKYEGEKINLSLQISEPLLIISKKIDLYNNNIMKLMFDFPSLTYEEQNILEYISYMIKGKKPGSFFYDIYKRKYIQDFEIYTIYNIKTPSQIIIKFKLYSIFNVYILRIVIARLINFLKILINDKNLVEETYKNFQKFLLKKFMFKNYNNKENYYDELFDFTNNYLIINNKDNNKIYNYYENNNNFINIFSKKYILPEFNFNLIENNIKNIIDLNNLLAIVELFPKNLNFINNEIISELKTEGKYKNYLTAKINKNNIIKYANDTYNYDFTIFNLKKNKINYLSKEKSIIQIYKINDKNTDKNKEKINNKYSEKIPDKIQDKIHLILNNISNKIWYIFDYNIKYPKIFSSFHIIYPNIRSNQFSVEQINLKYYNYLHRLIEIEFEELLDVNDDNFYINLNKDENGLNLEINTYSDIYLLVIKKIFSFIFEFDKNARELANIDYNSQINDNQILKAISYLKKVIKREINENYFEEINKQFSSNDINSYANEISQNMHIDGLLYGYLDKNILQEVRNMLFIYNTREYDNYSFFEDIPNFKQRIYDYTNIKEGSIYVYKLRQNFEEDNVSYYISFYQLNDCDDYKELFIIIIYLLLKEYLPRVEVHRIFTDNIYYILIISKSFDNPELIAEYINKNIKNLVDIISNKKYLELKKLLFSLKGEIKNEISNFNSKYNYIWNQIYYDKYSFEQYDKLNNIYTNYFSLKSQKTKQWKNEFINYLNENLITKQKKVEFLFYKDFINITNNKEESKYPWNSYNNNNSLKIFNNYSLESIKN